MSKPGPSQDIPLPRSWPNHIKAGVLHAISLAHAAVVCSRGWAVNSSIERARLTSELRAAENEISLLEEEIRIKDARMAKMDPRKRPRYSPSDRMAILELKSARGWNRAETARTFQIEADTVSSWMERSDVQEDALLQTAEPVNKYPDYVRYIVQRLKVLCPIMGKKRIAQTLARAGLYLGTTTVGRVLKEEPVPTKPEFPEPQKAQADRVVTSRYPHHVWNVDLTIIPVVAFWVPWWPFCLSQVWPFCWWVAVVLDHFSRTIVGVAVFRKEPSSEEMTRVLALAIVRVGKAPKHLISDQRGQFTGGVFRNWCADKLRDIRQRFGAVGEFGSIAVLERCIRSMKTECTRKIRVPAGLEAVRRELNLYVTWYNHFRPHQGLGGRVPMEVCQGIETTASSIETRGEDGVLLELLVSFIEEQRHLPIVELREAA